jgi:hypothetical protein
MKFEERIHRAANQTWQAIGSDVLQAKGACDRKEFPTDKIDYSVTMTRDEVVECVFDFLGSHGELSKEDMVRFRELSHNTKVELLTGAFPCDVYGW